eukprot:6176686-Pleurochrysis_carterae.AAC.1
MKGGSVLLRSSTRLRLAVPGRCRGGLAFCRVVRKTVAVGYELRFRPATAYGKNRHRFWCGEKPLCPIQHRKREGGREAQNEESTEAHKDRGRERVSAGAVNKQTGGRANGRARAHA